MRTITIETSFFFFLTQSELNQRCLEGTGNDQADPFRDSYMETGDRSEYEEQEDDEQELEEDREPEDTWVDTDYTLSGDYD